MKFSNGSMDFFSDEGISLFQEELGLCNSMEINSKALNISTMTVNLSLIGEDKEGSLPIIIKIEKLFDNSGVKEDALRILENHSINIQYKPDSKKTKNK